VVLPARYRIKELPGKTHARGSRGDSLAWVYLPGSN